MGVDTRKTILFTQDFEDGIAADGIDQAYIKGNIRENKNHSLTQDAKNVTYNATGNIPTSYQYRVNQPLFESFATIHTAKDAMKIVTSYGGAIMPMRDEQHQRVVSETLNGTWTYKGSKSGIRGEIDSEADITEHENGWEEFPEETRAADWDSDKDGMPDWWEKCVGSDPATPNNNDDPDRDGWTLLEDYLNFMAHPYVVIAPNGSNSIDLKEHFVGFFGQNGKAVTPTFSIEGNIVNGLYAANIDGTTLNVSATKPDTESVGTINVTVDDGETTFTQRFGIAITGNMSTVGISESTHERAGRVVSREFYTLDGKRVEEMQPMEVYLMKVTNSDGSTRTTKIIKN